MDNGEEVVDEVGCWSRFLVMLDHETGTISLAEVLEEVESKAAKAVSVGNHNLFDSSRADGVHQGDEPSASEVDS